MKKLSLVVRCCLVLVVVSSSIFISSFVTVLSVQAESKNVIFSWKPNVEEVDGYHLCCGIQSRRVVEYDFCVDVGNPPLTAGRVEYALSGLTEEQGYFCAVKAYKVYPEVESAFCNELNFVASPVENDWSSQTEFPTWNVDYDGDGVMDTLFLDEDGIWFARGSYAAIPEASILLQPQFANWDPSKHIIYVVKFDNDQWYDIIGFGGSGVLASWGIDGNHTSSVNYLIHDFGYNQGWRVGNHIRKFWDIDSNGHPDIIGMGGLGIRAAYNNGDRTVSLASNNGYVINDFGYSGGNGWLIPHHIRKFVDIDGDGAKDFIGIGNTKLYACWGQKDANGFPTGTFDSKVAIFSGNFCNFHGWKKDKHPRIFRDIDGDGDKDFIGFGNSGVVVLKNIGGRSFQGWSYVTSGFSRDDGWDISNIRDVKDVNLDGWKDFSGWKNSVHYVSLQEADGTFDSVVEWYE